MNTKPAAVLAVALAVTLAASTSFAVNYAVSASSKRNNITWLSDAPMEKIKGTASGASGSITLDPSNPKSLAGTVSVPVKSMKSGNPIRDRHLKGKEWLDAASHPNLIFKVVSVAKADPASHKWTVLGDFTCHGVTKRIKVPMTIKHNAKSIKVQTSFQIALADYKVKGKAGVVGKKVGDRISLNITLYGKAAQ